MWELFLSWSKDQSAGRVVSAKSVLVREIFLYSPASQGKIALAVFKVSLILSPDSPQLGDSPQHTGRRLPAWWWDDHSGILIPREGDQFEGCL